VTSVQENSYDELVHVDAPKSLSSSTIERNKPDLIKIDPTRCYPWEFHNRDTAWLTKDRCKDLITSIREHGQVEPILVRTVKNDPNYDYEIIFGLRRWYACSQIPNQKILACVTEANDKTCAVLMHTENANRKDIMDFERACSFAQQMSRGLFNSQTELANAVGITQGFVSKLLQAATLLEYEWLSPLLKNKLDIPIRYAYELAKLLKNPNTFECIKTKAESLQVAFEQTGFSWSTPQILKQLVDHAKSPHMQLQKQVLLNMGHHSQVICHYTERGRLLIDIDNRAKHLTPEKVKDVITKILEQYL